ncbi:ATP-binding protein [Streptomyces sp. CHD11]|uniref:ATP-binding protein n=1 Tax=Streptomyces sp. CHD11 TaxID=2741325 RepID=UPI001BFC1F85|nr:ATP-binding protein [Streptomyces sp. CHD11]MBT3152746.1 ATP-binding protein [Streptomyces sp. CHD11]
MAAHQLALSVPTTPAAVTAVRHQAMNAITGWETELDDALMHTAELVISELVTNAVRHAGTGQVSLSVQLVQAGLRIEVDDSNPALPQLCLPDQHAENGRGLFLVAVLADRYGADPTPTGKRCWAEIGLPTCPGREIAVSLPLQRN